MLHFAVAQYVIGKIATRTDTGRTDRTEAFMMDSEHIRMSPLITGIVLQIWDGML